MFPESYWHLAYLHLGCWHLGYWHSGYWYLGYWNLCYWHIGLLLVSTLANKTANWPLIHNDMASCVCIVTASSGICIRLVDLAGENMPIWGQRSPTVWQESWEHIIVYQCITDWETTDLPEGTMDGMTIFLRHFYWRSSKNLRYIFIIPLWPIQK